MEVLGLKTYVSQHGCFHSIVTVDVLYITKGSFNVLHFYPV